MQRICTNCLKKGHGFKACKKPIVSFGILLFKIEFGRIYFLLIQRKDTMGYIDFVRGKYKNDNNTDTLQTLKIFTEEMTQKEKQKLLITDFDTLWDDLWSNKECRSYLNDKQEAKERYLKLDVESLIGDTKTKYFEQEYGIPKGRRHHSRESDLTCAEREFFEETGLSKTSYNVIMNAKPLKEEFLGSNGIMYRHVYFLAEYKGNEKPQVDPNNHIQAEEVRSIGWYTLKEVFKLFRSYDTAKKACVFQSWLNISQCYGLDGDISKEFS